MDQEPLRLTLNEIVRLWDFFFKTNLSKPVNVFSYFLIGNLNCLTNKGNRMRSAE